MNVDDALDPIFNDARVDAYKAKLQSTYEEKIVKKILVATGLKHELNDLKKLAKDKTGNEALSFALFFSEHPDLSYLVGHA